tara:strand:- start:46532 stop:48409 length:1878 start_codon:yes stop_codon:yes gene_type:complete
MVDADNTPAVPQPPVELTPVADFLATTMPFDTLASSELARLLPTLAISYHTRGECFTAGSEPCGLRILRSGAVDLHDADNTLLDRLGEGESFHIDGLNAERGQVQARVIEDALIYFLPDTAYQALRQAHRNIDRHFSSQRNRRLRRAARYQPAANALLQSIRDTMSTDLLTVCSSDTLQAVAEDMTQRRVSSALVLRGTQLEGIITDRDLRARALTAALPADTAIASIMTANPEAIEADCSLFDATLLMTRRGYHHLPVTEAGQLCGMLTTSDLILARQNDPVYLVQHISRQESPEGIKALLEGMPGLVVQWSQSGMHAHQVSRVLTAISDAVTVRLIQLAEAELGPPPAAWCWVGFGSQARAEQLFGADQDNGMIISDEARDADAGWFAGLAQRVCDGLQLCGYPYCQGGVMATTDSWRQPLQRWQDTVRNWAATPSPAAVMRVSIFFDLRAIYGDDRLCAELQQVMLQEASRNSIFLAALAANALESRPPLGMFRRFVVERNGEHRDAVDLKKRGVLPITEIVRLHALANGIAAVNTEERLQALTRAKKLTMGDGRNLADALHCVQQQRLQHQCQQILAGEPPDNFLKPHGLPTLAREQLRDAFTLIDESQAAVRQTYRAGMN